MRATYGCGRIEIPGYAPPPPPFWCTSPGRIVGMTCLGIATLALAVLVQTMIRPDFELTWAGEVLVIASTEGLALMGLLFWANRLWYRRVLGATGGSPYRRIQGMTSESTAELEGLMSSRLTELGISPVERQLSQAGWSWIIVRNTRRNPIIAGHRVNILWRVVGVGDGLPPIAKGRLCLILEVQPSRLTVLVDFGRSETILRALLQGLSLTETGADEMGNDVQVQGRCVP